MVCWHCGTHLWHWHVTEMAESYSFHVKIPLSQISGNFLVQEKYLKQNFTSLKAIFPVNSVNSHTVLWLSYTKHFCPLKNSFSWQCLGVKPADYPHNINFHMDTTFTWHLGNFSEWGDCWHPYCWGDITWCLINLGSITSAEPILLCTLSTYSMCVSSTTAKSF